MAVVDIARAAVLGMIVLVLAPGLAYAAPVAAPPVRFAQLGADDPESGATERRREPLPYPTAGDPRRWERPVDKLFQSERRDRDDPDADVDTARDEAAELRREAAELQQSLDRLETQRKRGARPKDDPAAARRRAEQIEEQISDLQQRARALDDEAATLAEPPPGAGVPLVDDGSPSLPHEDGAGGAAAGGDAHEPADALTDDIDDELGGDDDLDGGMD